MKLIASYYREIQTIGDFMVNLSQLPFTRNFSARWIICGMPINIVYSSLYTHNMTKILLSKVHTWT